MKKPVRNLIIFAVVALGAGFAGMALDRLNPPEDPMGGAGALIWLVSPLVACLLLRLIGNDGWFDFGLGPRFRKSWAWYPVALLIAPAVVAVTLGMGMLTGNVSLNGSVGGPAAFLPLMAAAFGGAMVKNVFEEFAWRGYLTPRLEAIGTHPFLNSLLTGIVWAGWHVPYYLYYLDRAVLLSHTTLPLAPFIGLSFLLLIFQALGYGELRLLSNSVWPVWLLHNMANAVSLPLFSGGLITVEKGIRGVLFSPGTEGVIHSLLMGLIGLVLFFIRRRRTLGGG